MSQSQLDENDISVAELRGITERLDRLFDRYPVLPYYSIQYRLSEVGRIRVDARALQRALRELGNNKRPRHGRVDPGPREPIRGFYIGAGAAWSDALGASAVDAVREFVADSTHAVTDLVKGFLPRIEQDTFAVTVTSRASDNEISVPASDSILAVPAADGFASVWVSHDPDWIYPDDPRLWRFLRQCRDWASRPVILARKVAPATFSLLKAFDAYAVQYYAYIVSQSARGKLSSRAKTTGWFSLKSISDLDVHPARERLQAVVGGASREQWREDREAALNSGLNLGLASDTGDRAVRFQAWINQSSIELRGPFRASADRWAAFERYRRGKAPRALTVTERPEPAPSACVPDAEDTPHETDHTGESDQVPRGFGRRTTKTRVPLTLR